MTLVLDKICIRYGNGVKALDNISFEIGRGLYGLLGANGAGKSTLMRTIATLQKPDSGNLFFDGTNILAHPIALRQQLGYLPQDFGVYPKISAENLLDYFAILKGIGLKKERQQIIQQALELCNLYEHRKRSVEGFSGGMKQRFGIAQLLLGNPKLIIVDEPTSGLDPEERNHFIHIIRELSIKNTIIFSTHIVDDIKDICREIIIIDKGQLKLQSSVDEAVKTLENKIWVQDIVGDEPINYAPPTLLLSKKYNSDQGIRLRIYSDQQPNSRCRLDFPSLEDVFLIIKNNPKP